MSAEITSTVWGVAPWSDELLKISGDVDRGRLPAQAWAERVKEDSQAYYELLDQSGITYRNGDGEVIAASDYFSAAVMDAAEGFSSSYTSKLPVTRWFDTNTFYRQPTITGPLHLFGTELFHGFVKARAGRVAYQPTLLSPYAFAKLSARAPYVSEDEAAGHVQGLYDELLDATASRQHQINRLLFYEPYAAYHQIDSAQRKKLVQSIGDLTTNHPKLEVGVYFGNGDATALLEDCSTIGGLAAVGADLTRTPHGNLPRLLPRRFLAGFIDGANTLIDEDDAIIEEIEALSARLEVPEISVTHTVDLRHVPRPTAFEKIEQIGRVTQNYGGRK